MSFGTIVNRSQVTLEILISCKSLTSPTGNSRRSRPGCGSVVNRSQSFQSVSRRSDRGCDSRARVYADRLTNGVRGSRTRKSVVL